MTTSTSLPLVSVIIPAYGVAPFIAETVASALAQTYPAFEILVINDGSPDTPALEAALAPYRNRITYLVQENAGVSAARNTGIRAARGELIAFLDGDDIWYPEFLASQVAFLLGEGADMVYCNALLFGDHPQAGLLYTDTTPSRGAVTVRSLLTHECQPITSGTVLRRTILPQPGPFNLALRRGQDFELWIRLAHAGARISYQRQVLLRYRIREGSLSGNPVQRAERELGVFRAVQDLSQADPGHAAIVEHQIRKLEALVEKERGKASLLAGDYHLARHHLAVAYRKQPELKLLLVRVLLRLAPGLLRVVYARLGVRD